MFAKEDCGECNLCERWHWRRQHALGLQGCPNIRKGIKKILLMKFEVKEIKCIMLKSFNECILRLKWYLRISYVKNPPKLGINCNMNNFNVFIIYNMRAMYTKGNFSLTQTLFLDIVPLHIIFNINIIEGDRNCVKSQNLRTYTGILRTLIFSYKISDWIFLLFRPYHYW